MCDAKFFSLLAAEKTYFSRQEEIKVCVCARARARYVSDSTMKEILLCFTTTHDLTGAGLDDLTGAGLDVWLLRIVADAGVDSTNMVGQGYDGAAAMSGKKNGVQKHARDTTPTARHMS